MTKRELLVLRILMLVATILSQDKHPIAEDIKNLANHIQTNL